MPSNNVFKPTRITYDLLKEWVPAEERAEIRLLAAWKVIANFFCGTLASRGVCPQNAEQEVPCAFCRETVAEIFKIENADNPEAVLTWRTRDAASKFGDALLEKQRAEERKFLAQESAGTTFPSSERDLARAEYLALFRRDDGEPNLFLELAKQYEHTERKQPAENRGGQTGEIPG